MARGTKKTKTKNVFFYVQSTNVHTACKQIYSISEGLKFHDGERLRGIREHLLKNVPWSASGKKTCIFFFFFKSSKVKKRDVHIIIPNRSMSIAFSNTGSELIRGCPETEG